MSNYVGLFRATQGGKNYAGICIWDKNAETFPEAKGRLEEFINQEFGNVHEHIEIIDRSTGLSTFGVVMTGDIEVLVGKAETEFRDIPQRRHNDKNIPIDANLYEFVVEVLGTGMKRMTRKGVKAIVHHQYKRTDYGRDLSQTDISKRIQAYRDAGYRIIGTSPEGDQEQDEFVVVDIEGNGIWELMELSELEQEVPLELDR